MEGQKDLGLQEEGKFSVYIISKNIQQERKLNKCKRKKMKYAVKQGRKNLVNKKKKCRQVRLC